MLWQLCVRKEMRDEKRHQDDHPRADKRAEHREPDVLLHDVPNNTVAM